MTTTPAFRHEDVCNPGMWLQVLGRTNWGPLLWHIHAHCVVDDYGTLQPVAFSGMTVTGKVVEGGV